MTNSEETLEVVGETASVEKRDQVTGRVRVTTTTSSTEELVSAVLERTDIAVTRVSIDQEIDAVPSVRTESDVTIIPVVEEILVITKRLVLREEIHLRKITTTQSVEVPVTLRKQHAVIERDAPENQDRKIK